MSQDPFYGTIRAPEFPPDLEWVNTSRPLRLADLRGKLVLLDFWTYGCINCIHILPDLRQLEELFAEELVVIGVHSAKFANEREGGNLRRIVARYEIEHPVLNDAEMQVWDAYAVRAWPTTVLIDPRGRIVGSHSGEGVLEALLPLLQQAVRRYDEDDALDRTPLMALLAGEPRAPSALSFPGKVLAGEGHDRLFVADTNHHRIIVCGLDGRVRAAIGSGRPGFADGAYADAAFRKPQGLALRGDTLYVADTENHAIRAVDLRASTVRTIAGTGTIGYAALGTRPLEVALNSPWDLALHGDRLYIAMAGLHQIWVLDLAAGEIAPWAGSGAEGLFDGPLGRAALAQPSGLSIHDEQLYFADSEASAIRVAGLGPYGRVRTLVGQGLFDFGYRDGPAEEALLQHPLGVLWHEGSLYVADTYNHVLRTVDPESGAVHTLLGEGKPGYRDGEEPLFHEPGGLSAAGERLYVADTNNHVVRVVDLRARAASTLELQDPDGLLEGAPEPAGERAARRAGRPATRLGEQRVAAGEGTVVVRLQLPAGHALTGTPPTTVELIEPPNGVVRLAEAQATVDTQTLEARLSARFQEGLALLQGVLSVYYCAPEDVGLCLFQGERVLVPLRVTAGGRSREVVVEVPVRPGET